jgi:peptidoglycan/xylan/chitin deacetylase (PgdA/CDA1 family)
MTGSYTTWKTVDERIKALRMWLDYGFELGNQTFSHMSLNQPGLKAWEDDVIQGENVARLLLAEHKMTLRYFRHPLLDTGRDLETRRDADAFLVARGYRIAPVTLDAWDWMSAGVYEDAGNRGDSALQQELVTSYLSYSAQVFAYYEQLSKQLIGYEPKQILLLHANQLEADHIAELIELMRKRGYRFITLGDALSDQAFSLPDIRRRGRHRLARSLGHHRGQAPQGVPVFSQWVIDAPGLCTSRSHRRPCRHASQSYRQHAGRR